MLEVISPHCQVGLWMRFARTGDAGRLWEMYTVARPGNVSYVTGLIVLTFDWSRWLFEGPLWSATAILRTHRLIKYG